jgi:hypothetical protein
MSSVLVATPLCETKINKIKKSGISHQLLNSFEKKLILDVDNGRHLVMRFRQFLGHTKLKLQNQNYSR